MDAYQEYIENSQDDDLFDELSLQLLSNNNDFFSITMETIDNF